MNQEMLNVACEFRKGVETKGQLFLDSLIERFKSDERSKIHEETLHFLFESMSDCSHGQEAILVKVTCLNEYYSTRLASNLPKNPKNPNRKVTPDIITMSRHIFELECNPEEGNSTLMEYINEGNPQAVELIRKIPKNDSHEFSDSYSFATKYCSWHNPECYPIVDGYSRAMVYYLCNLLYGGSLENPVELNVYEKFCAEFNNLNDWINEKCKHSYTSKEIDMALWWYSAKDKEVSGKARTLTKWAL